MDAASLALFAAAELVASLVPGPAVILVAGMAMRHGFRQGIQASLGILLANVAYFAISAAGVGALILASAAVFSLLKLAGAAYLVFIGVRMMLPLFDASAPDAPEPAPRVPHSGRAAIRRGFVLQASNPKSLVFFIALLPQFVDPAAPLAPQILVLGVVSVLIELPVLAFYAFGFSALGSLMRRRVMVWIEGAAGGVLAAMGGALLMVRRA